MKKQTWRQWARSVARDVERGDPPHSGSELSSACLAALTGQDVRALDAIVACFELYASSDDDGQRGALAAVRALLPAMQESTRWIARELIPFVLDWSDRERLWALTARRDGGYGPAYVYSPCPFESGSVPLPPIDSNESDP